MTALTKYLSEKRTELYVISIAVAAALLFLALAVHEGERGLGPHPMLFVSFAFLVVALDIRPHPSLTEDSTFTFSWTFAFALLLVAPVWAGVLACATASLTSDTIGRRPPIRVLFNASQFAVSLSLAWLSGDYVADLHAVRDGGGVSLRWLAGVLVLLLVGIGLNSLLLGVVVAMHQSLPIVQMTVRFMVGNLNTDGLLFALAPVFVLVGIYGPWLLPVLLLIVWTILQSARIAMRNQNEATHDQLTELPNRRMFDDHATMAIDVARSTQQSMAIIHIDLDGFKGINDRLGHQFGDEVLKIVAERLLGAKRPNDLVARLGGDEFAILMPSVDSIDDGLTVAHRLLEQIQIPFEVDNIPLSVGASLGVAMFPEHGQDRQALLHSSDMAMYAAKRRGTGVEAFEGTADRKGPGRLAVISDLAEAIESDDQFTLHYQPVLNAGTGRILRLEALLRWEHPRFGWIPPADFMPQTEQTNLIGALTTKVMGMAFEDCSRWKALGATDVGVAVNTSARNVHDSRFSVSVKELMSRHGLEGSDIELEITENAIMEDVAGCGVVLQDLRAMGISIAIDDFGTGFSSLTALRDLTIDRIKIDRSFVSSLHGGSPDYSIVRSVIDLGSNLGLQTVAEGIESVEVLTLLQQLGCEEYQGFLACSPRPLNELLPILKNGFLRPAGARFEPIASDAINPEVFEGSETVETIS